MPSYEDDETATEIPRTRSSNSEAVLCIEHSILYKITAYYQAVILCQVKIRTFKLLKNHAP